MTDCLSCQFTRALEAENAIKTNIIILREHEIVQLNDKINILNDFIAWQNKLITHCDISINVNKTMAETSLQNESV